jgi:hypothetical protein
MRPPRQYIPGYDTPSYATGLYDFLRERPGRGRPKTPIEVKEFELVKLLLDIDQLKLTHIISWAQIAHHLCRKFPDARHENGRQKYPKTKSSNPRKNIAAAFVLLRKNSARVKDERLSRLLIMYEKYLAK